MFLLMIIWHLFYRPLCRMIVKMAYHLGSSDIWLLLLCKTNDIQFNNNNNTDVVCKRNFPFLMVRKNMSRLRNIFAYSVFQLGPFHRADCPPLFKWHPVPFSWCPVPFSRCPALFQSLYAFFKKMYRLFWCFVMMHHFSWLRFLVSNARAS